MPKLDEDEIYSLVEKLPVVSHAAIKVIALIDNPKTSREEIVELVASDESLFAECFKQANSAALASLREYTSINEIVDVLGFNHIKKVALFVAAKSIISDPTIWFESVFTAVAAQYVAMKAGMSRMESDGVYMAGLFTNYGAFFLKRFFPNIYQKIEQISDYKERIQEEHTEFGYSYPELSAMILEKYNVPEFVTKIIQTQGSVYSSERTKENIYIEIARILFLMQEANPDDLRERLAVDEIREMVQGSGLSLVEIDDSSLARINKDTAEFAR